MNVVRELFVVAFREQAEHAGFRGQRHPRLPDVRAWWPSMGTAALEGMKLERITIDSRVRLDRADRDHLRACQAMFPDPIWMEF